MGLPKNYYNFFAICKLEEITEGSAKRAVGGGGLKGISGITKLKPIAHLFREFRHGERKQYGILKSHYDKWKQTGEVPKVSPGRPKKWDKDATNIRIIAPPFYDQFKKGVARCNENSVQQITIQEFIWICMKEGMDRRPDIFYPESNTRNDVK